MVLIKYAEIFLTGFGRNLLITAACSAFPLVVGILLSLLASKFPIVGKIFGWLSLPFECVFIPALMIVIYYTLGRYFRFLFGGFDLSLWISVGIAVTVGFIGYMPARHVQEYSFLKNILYNGLGLIASVFRWSFCVFLIGCVDIFGAARSVAGISYKYVECYLIPLVVFFLVLFVLEVARRLVKQLMK